MLYKELAIKLNHLGIMDIKDEMIERLQTEWDQETEEFKEYVSQVTLLLMELGCGYYDQETWTPSSKYVYAFDMECFDVEAMYKYFFEGVAAIGDGDLDFYVIDENLDKVDWENGTGIRSITFQWNNHQYTLDAQVMNDWFDFSFADKLNQIIIKECSDKQLYFSIDEQTIFVLYCDENWATSFVELTGMRLTKKLN